MDASRFKEPDFVELARQRVREQRRRHAEGNGHAEAPAAEENLDFQFRPREPDPEDPGPPPQEIGIEPPEPTISGDGKKTPAFPAIKRASELQIADESHKWIWEGCLERGSITLFSAFWKAGKTTFITYLAKAFQRDKKFCGRDVCPAKVLYVTEESESRWAERRDQLKLGDHIFFLSRPFVAKPDWGQWREFLFHLRDWVRANPVDQIVFDTLSNLWPVKDENDAAQVQSALMPLHQLTGENIGLMVTHHLRKGDGKEGTGSRGSGQITAFVDFILEMRRYAPDDRQDRRRVLTGYGRWDGIDEMVCELLPDKAGYVAHGDRQEVAEKDLRVMIARLLPNEPPGKTVDQLRDDWPGDETPKRSRIVDELNRGLDAGEWHREGDGKKGSAFTWWMEPPPLI